MARGEKRVGSPIMVSGELAGAYTAAMHRVGRYVLDRSGKRKPAFAPAKPTLTGSRGCASTCRREMTARVMNQAGGFSDASTSKIVDP
jgi:hypothetical protein